MNTREIAVEYRLAHWAEIMRERHESGLSIKAYCEARGFHENKYYYWQRKLREAASQQLLPAEHENSGQAVIPKGWSQCSVSGSGQEEQSVAIEIGKCRINVTVNTNQELLSNVCRLLEGLC